MIVVPCPAVIMIVEHNKLLKERGSLLFMQSWANNETCDVLISDNFRMLLALKRGSVCELNGVFFIN